MQACRCVPKQEVWRGVRLGREEGLRDEQAALVALLPTELTAESMSAAVCQKELVCPPNRRERGAREAGEDLVVQNVVADCLKALPVRHSPALYYALAGGIAAAGGCTAVAATSVCDACAHQLYGRGGHLRKRLMVDGYS